MTSIARSRSHQSSPSLIANKLYQEQFESAPDSPNSPGGGFLGRLGKNFQAGKSSSNNDLTMLLAHHPSSPDTKRRLSASGQQEQSPSSVTSTASRPSSRRPSSSSKVSRRKTKKIDLDGSNSSSLSLDDELQRLALLSPTTRPDASSISRSCLSLDMDDEDDDDNDVSVQDHLVTSVASLSQFQYDSPQSCVRTPRYRHVNVEETLTLVELDSNDSGDDVSLRTPRKRSSEKKSKKIKKSETKDKKMKRNGSSNKLASSPFTSPVGKSSSKSKLTAMASPSSVMSDSRRQNVTEETMDCFDPLSPSQSSPSHRGRSSLRSLVATSSPHHRGVAPLSSNRPTRRLSDYVKQKPFIPKIVNTMKEDLLRIQQLEGQLKATEEGMHSELAAIEKNRSKTMRKLKAVSSAEYQQMNGTPMPRSSDIESNQRAADLLRRENAQIREHNQTMRTNCQNLRINNARLEEKTVELDDYKKRLDAHHKRVSEEHDKLKTMDEQYEKEVRELEEQVEKDTMKAQIDHLNRTRFERRVYEFAELIKLHDRDNRDLHRRIEAIIAATDAQKHQWSPSKVDRPEVKGQVASSRRASMRESL